MEILYSHGCSRRGWVEVFVVSGGNIDWILGFFFFCRLATPGDVISRSGTRGFGGHAVDSGAGATAAAAAAVYADAAGIWKSGA